MGETKAAKCIGKLRRWGFFIVFSNSVSDGPALDAAQLVTCVGGEMTGGTHFASRRNSNTFFLLFESDQNPC